MSKSIIRDKSFQFSLNVISLYKELMKENEFIISRQLLKSGTSIGANIEEALAGQRKKILLQKCQYPQKKQEKPNIGYVY